MDNQDQPRERTDFGHRWPTQPGWYVEFDIGPGSGAHRLCGPCTSKSEAEVEEHRCRVYHRQYNIFYRDGSDVRSRVFCVASGEERIVREEEVRS